MLLQLNSKLVSYNHSSCEHMMNNRYKIGKGLVNSLIDKIPFEAHIPGYQYCGPGTKLEKRLARGDPGINPLDKACKAHDIAYSNNKSSEERTKADKILSSEAWKRVTSKDASATERAAAIAVTAAMKTKIGVSKLGRGLRKIAMLKKKQKKKHHHQTKCCTFKQLVNATTKSLKGSKPKTANEFLNTALSAAKSIKSNNKTISQPRVIPIPKTGGLLPLVPIFAGLSALGSLAGGSAALVRTIGKANEAKKQLAENKRHNKTMEAIAIGKSSLGEGIYLRPYKNGYGLFLNPYPTSKKN